MGEPVGKAYIACCVDVPVGCPEEVVNSNAFLNVVFDPACLEIQIFHVWNSASRNENFIAFDSACFRFGFVVDYFSIFRSFHFGCFCAVQDPDSFFEKYIFQNSRGFFVFSWKKPCRPVYQCDVPAEPSQRLRKLAAYWTSTDDGHVSLISIKGKYRFVGEVSDFFQPRDRWNSWFGPGGEDAFFEPERFSVHGYFVSAFEGCVPEEEVDPIFFNPFCRVVNAYFRSCFSHLLHYFPEVHLRMRVELYSIFLPFLRCGNEARCSYESL